MIYFTSDLHFGHDKVIEYCNRPFKNATVMDKQLMKNWNSVVDNDDTIYVVGDLSLKSSLHIDYISQITTRLNGIKHLILGNHDVLKPFDYIYRLGFTSVHTSLDVGRFILNHDPSISCIDRSKVFLCGHVHDLFKTTKNVI